jgi:predicted dithiol-disulfide oxidoreductase (DUF899 family)
MLSKSHAELDEWWVKLGAHFERAGEAWRVYTLELFEGRETIIVHQAMLLPDAGEVWEALRDSIENAVNAYMAPDAEGHLRPEYRVTHLIVRLHRGTEPPLY